jgi:hypothetical protein
MQMYICKGEGKDKFQPRTGNEDPEGSRGITLLFF